MLPAKRAPDAPPHRSIRLIMLSALFTGLFLGITLSFPFWYGLAYYYASTPVQARLAIYLSPDSLQDFWQPSVVLGGVVWGLTLAGLSGVRPLWRLAAAGRVGVFLGQALWPIPAITIPDALWPDVRPHFRFAREFVVGVGTAAGLTALIVRLAIRWERAALWLGLAVALAAALPAFLVVVALETLGIRWGAGNANMAKVAGLGFPAATVCSGAVIGWYLARLTSPR